MARRDRRTPGGGRWNWIGVGGGDMVERRTMIDETEAADPARRRPGETRSGEPAGPGSRSGDEEPWSGTATC